MLNRLRDEQDDADPVLARAARLLSAGAPTDESPELERRVWVSLWRRRSPGFRWTVLTRPSIAASVLVFSTAAAAAALGHGWVERTYRSIVMHAAPAQVDRPGLSHVERRSALAQRNRADGQQIADEGVTPSLDGAQVDPPPVAAATATAPARAPQVGLGPPQPQLDAPLPNARQAPAPVPHVHAMPGPAAAVRSASRSERGSAAGRAAWAAAPRDEASLVLSAMTALRRDHDATRSARLLDDYLDRYPHGVLREEALALSIECAAERGDWRASERFARTYLTSFPTGRFRDIARTALDRGAPLGEAP